MKYLINNKNRKSAGDFFPALIRIAFVLLSFSIYIGAAEDPLFEKDVEKQKQMIEADFKKCNEYLSKNQVGQTREILELIIHRLDGIKKDMVREDRDSYKKRTDRVGAAITAKEDSLVNRNLEILEKEGMDAAIAFLREKLEPLRVSREKVGQVDEAITMAASNQKTPEEKAREDAIVLVRKGVQPEQIKDELVRAAAVRVVQQRADSISAVQDSLRAVREEQARLQKLEQERLAAEQRRKEELEQRKREAELVRQEKLRLDSIDLAKKEAERNRLRAAKEKDRQEKLELDSLEEARKIQQKQAKASRKSIEDEERIREQAIRDSVIHAAELNQKKMAELDAKQRQRTIEDEQKRSELSSLEDAKRQREADELAERQRQIRTSEKKRIEEERSAERIREQDERTRLANLEKQRMERDALAAEQERQRRADIEEQNRRAEMEAQERERQRIEAENRRIQEASRKTVKISAPPSAPKVSARAKVSSSQVPVKTPAPSAPVPVQSVPSVKTKESDPIKAKAQKTIEEIYAMLEDNKAEDAYTLFQRSRNEIARHANPEIYTTLEMTVLELYMESQKQKKADLAVFTGAPTYETYEPEQSQSQQNARFQAAKIEGLIRQNKIQPAYDMFKRVKPELKKSLDRETYRKIEEKVENAYKAIK